MFFVFGATAPVAHGVTEMTKREFNKEGDPKRISVYCKNQNNRFSIASLKSTGYHWDKLPSSSIASFRKSCRRVHLQGREARHQIEI